MYSYDDLQTAFGMEHPYVKPACTMDFGANVSAAVELQGRFDWNRCICHVLHIAVEKGLR